MPGSHVLKNIPRITGIYLLQFHCQGNGVEEGIDLKDAHKEEAEVLKHFSKEVPEQSNIGSEVGNRKARMDRAKAKFTDTEQTTISAGK